MTTKPDDIATKIMAAMIRMPPKPHGEMKIGKRKSKSEELADLVAIVRVMAAQSIQTNDIIGEALRLAGL